MINARFERRTKIRLRGWNFLHTIKLVFEGRESYVAIFGVQIGPCSFYWTNPFAGD